MRRAPVEEIVPIDHRDDDIAEAHPLERDRRRLRLARVDIAARIACTDRAEAAAASTRLAEHHDGRRPSAPALEDIRAFRLGADSMKIKPLEAILHGLKARLILRPREADSEPIGFALWEFAHA